MDRDRIDNVAMGCEYGLPIAGRNIPDAHCLVLAATDESFTVWCKGEIEDAQIASLNFLL